MAGVGQIQSFTISPYSKSPFTLYIYIYISFCLFTYLSICLSVCLSIFLPVCLSVCLSAYLSIYLSMCLSTCLSIIWGRGWSTKNNTQAIYTYVKYQRIVLDGGNVTHTFTDIHTYITVNTCRYMYRHTYIQIYSFLSLGRKTLWSSRVVKKHPIVGLGFFMLSTHTL